MNAEDVLTRLADMMKPGAPAAAPEAPAAPAEAAPVYSADEMGVLAEYEKNWPDVSRAEQLKRRAEYGDMFAYIFQQVHNYVSPLFEQQRAIGNTIHMTELRSAIPDYSETLETDVATWIDTQPTYLQAPMKQVMQGGTSEEVADLIGRYRAASGTTPAAPQAPAPAPAGAPAAPAPVVPAKPATELSSAAKQAAESLAPVSGERSQVPQGEPQDFQSAFSKYAATMDI